MFGHPHLTKARFFMGIALFVLTWFGWWLFPYHGRNNFLAFVVMMCLVAFFAWKFWFSKANLYVFLVSGVGGLIFFSLLDSVAPHAHLEYLFGGWTAIPLWGHTGIFILKVFMSIYSWTVPYMFNQDWLDQLEEGLQEPKPKS